MDERPGPSKVGAIISYVIFPSFDLVFPDPLVKALFVVSRI